MMSQIQSEPLVVGTTRLPFVLCAVVIISTTVFQKIAVPGTAGLIPIALPVLALVVAIGVISQSFLVDIEAFAYFLILLLVGWISFLQSTSSYLSTTSLMLFAADQFPFVLRFAPSTLAYEDIINLVSSLAFLFAICAIGQFFSQFTIGRTSAFFLDYNLPTSIAIKGFDFLVPLYWLSPDFKSNGIFFAEPSLLSQFLAIGVVAEVVSRARLYRLTTLGGGLFCSYSGTGMIMLAIF